MQSNLPPVFHSLLILAIAAVIVIFIAAPGQSQDTVTGAFLGTVTNSLTGEPITGAEVAIINEQTGLSIPKTTDSEGRFFQGLLASRDL